MLVYAIRTNLVTSKSCMYHSLYRPSQAEQDKLTDYLLGLGATEVVTEEFTASHRMKEMMQVSNKNNYNYRTKFSLTIIIMLYKQSYPQPRLALNCVGGRSSANILKHLSDHATAVTYGGMSRQPVTIPTVRRVHCDYFRMGTNFFLRGCSFLKE